jgi:hypothetical protein
MTIELNHIFLEKCIDRKTLFSKMYKVVNGQMIDGVFDNTKSTVTNFMLAVEEQAKGKENLLSNGDYNWPVENYIGDGFELLVEAIIKNRGYMTEIGIRDYTPIENRDFGVDGVGVCTLDGKPITVQAKYRKSPNYELSISKDNLDSFWRCSVKQYGVPFECGIAQNKKKPKEAKRMIVFTTAKGICNHSSDIIYTGDMRCLGNAWFKREIDQNIGFWELFQKSLA